MDVNIPKIGWSVLFTFVFFTDEYDVMTSGLYLYYINSMILIYDCNDSGQYYKTTITIVFTILAKAKANLS